MANELLARRNQRIRVPEVRLIDEDGTQVGIVPTPRAIEIAFSKGLDLVEVAPKAKPPVCKIMDFGKYLYENSKKAKAAKKKQHQVNLKEMRFRPKTEEHDYQFKLKHVREFLEQGAKVKVFVVFRGRELAHKEMGYRIIDRLKEDLADLAEPELPTRMEGRHLSMMFLAKAKKK